MAGHGLGVIFWGLRFGGWRLSGPPVFLLVGAARFEVGFYGVVGRSVGVAGWQVVWRCP